MNTVCTFLHIFTFTFFTSPDIPKVANLDRRYDLHGKRENSAKEEKKTERMKQVRLGSPLHW